MYMQYVLDMCNRKTQINFSSAVSGNVVVVKTHCTDNRELPEDIQEALGQKSFDRAIVLVRNPYDALVSEANRRWNSKKNMDSHVGLADEKSFIGMIIQ